MKGAMKGAALPWWEPSWRRGGGWTYTSPNP